MNLQTRLDAIKADFESKAPPEAIAIMRSATEMLIKSAQAERALRSGQMIPDFELSDADGNRRDRLSLIQSGPVVLTFYRGIWCPFCNEDLRALEAARPDIEKRGAKLVAISPQTNANSRKTARDLALGFPILSDIGGAVAEKFGLRWQLPEDLKALYAQFGVDLPAFNDDTSWTLPMPARYVVDKEGLIRYSEINPDYTHRPDPSVVFPVLDGLTN